jgi:hypothetical protein
MNVPDMLALIADVSEEFVREEDQGLLQRDLHKAEMALAGKYACDRLARRFEGRLGVSMIPPRSAGRAK